MQGTAPPRLRAELRGPRAVWITLPDAGLHRPLDPAAYTLTTATGQPIPIATFLPSERTDGLLVPAEDLDIRRIHFLDIASLGLRVPVSFDGLFRTLYSPKPLGANVNQERTHTAFRVFAPRATALTLYLYASPEADTPTATHGLVQDADGVWECTLPADLHGTYYDFTVHGPDEPGNAFYERRPQHISDPYARVNVEAFGRSRVWYATTPATPLANGRPAMEDVVAYEVHVQDFTDLLPVDAAVRSTLPAMTVPGLTNAAGEPIGFDYLLDLGVNVVHLMPVQEFLHYPDATWREAFGGDAYMQEMGVAEE
ncbi:MAG: pullulanase, partial [Bacteroidota bacterium]